tara:strand:- start:1457 stop:1735 length:279 start_codon:yes stop_codon:yes gene_type:complete
VDSRDYIKLKEMLPVQKDMLDGRKKDLREATELITNGHKKFLSNEKVVNIKYAEFKNREKKLTLFIKSAIIELEESISNIEKSIEVYEREYK